MRRCRPQPLLLTHHVDMADDHHHHACCCSMLLSHPQTWQKPKRLRRRRYNTVSVGLVTLVLALWVHNVGMLHHVGVVVAVSAFGGHHHHHHVCVPQRRPRHFGFPGIAHRRIDWRVPLALMEPEPGSSTTTTTTSNTPATAAATTRSSGWLEHVGGGNDTSSSGSDGALYTDASAPLLQEPALSLALLAGTAISTTNDSNVTVKFGDVVAARFPTTVTTSTRTTATTTTASALIDKDIVAAAASVRRRNVVGAALGLVLALTQFAWQWTHPVQPIQKNTRLVAAIVGATVRDWTQRFAHRGGCLGSVVRPMFALGVYAAAIGARLWRSREFCPRQWRLEVQWGRH
jgi:hypothetical protein